MTPWRRRAPDIWLKQNDTSPAIAHQLLDEAGAAVNLTAASVKFMAWLPGAAAAKINAAATITGAATGNVSYTPGASDTDSPGDYLAEWQVTFSGGAIQTFPQSGYLKLRVTDDLAA